MGAVLPFRSPGSSAEPSDAELVEAARRGDERAHDRLYARHAPMVLGLLHRILGRADEIDDLSQEVFLAAFRALDRLQDPQAFAAYLGSITVRVARARIGRMRWRRRLGLGGVRPVDLDTVVARDAPPDVAAELRALYEVLDGLRPETRIALVLRRVEGLTVAEIAERMELSPATVKRRIEEGEVLLAARMGGGGAR